MTATTPDVATPRRGRSRGLGGLTRQWSVLAGCVLLWQLATAALHNTFFPTPLAIATAAWERWFTGPVVVDDLLPSIGRLLLGWGVAGLAGTSLGIVLGRWRSAMAYAGPLLSFARAIPPPALVPVFLVVFGIGFRMQLATIVFGSIWPVLLNSADGARSVDPTKIETSRAFRLGRMQWLFGVVLPSALPKIFVGLRISLSLALIMMVISELVGTANGIGHTMQLAQREFDYTLLWAGIVLLGVLGYTLNAALLAVEKRALAHRPPARPSSARSLGAPPRRRGDPSWRPCSK